MSRKDTVLKNIKQLFFDITYVNFE